MARRLALLMLIGLAPSAARAEVGVGSEPTAAFQERLDALYRAQDFAVSLAGTLVGVLQQARGKGRNGT